MFCCGPLRVFSRRAKNWTDNDYTDMVCNKTVPEALSLYFTYVFVKRTFT